ncbi:hypothetical protein G9P44_004870 [Scheffersomyces stipitis]|nr:hypothetical protein G9P44_004870 [Scheffersomyces stipitis]
MAAQSTSTASFKNQTAGDKDNKSFTASNGGCTPNRCVIV